MTRAMEQVGAGLEKIVAGSLRRSPAGQGPLLAWALACGQAVAARTRAAEFAQGTLRVEVPDLGWPSLNCRRWRRNIWRLSIGMSPRVLDGLEFVIVDRAAGEGGRPRA